MSAEFDFDFYSNLFNRSYYEHTTMSECEIYPFSKNTQEGTRFCRVQYYRKSTTDGWTITGGIAIPMFCNVCSGDGEQFWSDPKYISENCTMSEPKFSAIRNGDYDTIGWHSECNECGAQTFQIVDTPHPYEYNPDESS